MPTSPLQPPCLNGHLDLDDVFPVLGFGVYICGGEGEDGGYINNCFYNNLGRKAVKFTSFSGAAQSAQCQRKMWFSSPKAP